MTLLCHPFPAALKRATFSLLNWWEAPKGRSKPLSPPRGSHHPSKPHHKHRLQTDNEHIGHTTPTATARKSCLQSCKGKITSFICLPREPPVCSCDNPDLSKPHPQNLNCKTQFDSQKPGSGGQWWNELIRIKDFMKPEELKSQEKWAGKSHAG